MAPELFYINAVYEDAISFAVIKRIVKCSPVPLLIDLQFCRNGSSYIRDNIKKFHQAARHQPFIILLDSDTESCALTVLNKTIPEQLRHANCIFRIVVREIETWLLADSNGVSDFLGVNILKIPRKVEQISDPKRLIITLASKSKKRIIREGIAPSTTTSARIGPEYNLLLSQFVSDYWNIDSAVKNCESLRRAVLAIGRFDATDGARSVYSKQWI